MTTLDVKMSPGAAVRAEAINGPDVSVVIVTHDSAAFIGDCLRAVETSEFEGRIEVVVVDNGSTDGTAEAVRDGFSHVRLIRPSGRGGFARNSNLGIRASRGRYVLLLNPDTVLEPTSLSVLWRTLEDCPEAGAVGPLLVRADGVREASARRFPTLWRTLATSLMLDRLLAGVPGVGVDLGRDTDHDREVDWLTGACLMVRREAIDGNERRAPAGLLDDRIFLFVEDTEWCWRLHAFDWRVLYTPRARVLHHKGSGEGFCEWRYRLNCRGHAYFFRKHRGAASAWAYQALVVPGLLLRAAIAAAMLPLKWADRAELARRARGYLRLVARILVGGLEREEKAE